MTQFDKDYILGKKSEQDSINDLNKIFNCNLTQDQYEFAHFDFYDNDKNLCIELKTRPNTKYIDGKFSMIILYGNAQMNIFTGK